MNGDLPKAAEILWSGILGTKPYGDLGTLTKDGETLIYAGDEEMRYNLLPGEKLRLEVTNHKNGPVELVIMKIVSQTDKEYRHERPIGE
jgi:hypothetical protein